MVREPLGGLTSAHDTSGFLEDRCEWVDLKGVCAFLKMSPVAAAAAAHRAAPAREARIADCLLVVDAPSPPGAALSPADSGERTEPAWRLDSPRLTMEPPQPIIP